MVEQEAVNFEVAGSSPAAGAKIIYSTDYPASIHATGFSFSKYSNQSFSALSTE